jgi:hypothetical protein
MTANLTCPEAQIHIDDHKRGRYARYEPQRRRQTVRHAVPRQVTRRVHRPSMARH